MGMMHTSMGQSLEGILPALLGMSVNSSAQHGPLPDAAVLALP